MLRADSSLKKLLCILLIAVVALIPNVSGIAADDDVLYFGALEESIAQNVKTATVERGEFFVNGAINASLNFQSYQWVYNDIRQGTVHYQEFLVSEGDQVKKGDHIMRIRVEVDEIEKEEVELNLEAAKKNLDEYIADTRLLLNQYKLATEQGSERDRKVAQLSYERLETSFRKEVEKRESQIDEYTLRLTEIEGLAGREYIDAPVDGIIDRRSNFRKDEILGYWPAICTINDPTNVTVEVSGGSDLLRYNMPVKIVQANGNRTVELTGRVITMKSAASSVNLIAQTDVIEVYGDASAFAPGRDVSVRFDKIYVPDALMVPKAAVYNDKKGNYVQVYVNGFSSKRYVVIGGADSTRNWIVSGVEEGDILILND